jgi:hypothetical protein
VTTIWFICRVKSLSENHPANHPFDPVNLL